MPLCSIWEKCSIMTITIMCNNTSPLANLSDLIADLPRSQTCAVAAHRLSCKLKFSRRQYIFHSGFMPILFLFSSNDKRGLVSEVALFLRPDVVDSISFRRSFVVVSCLFLAGEVASFIRTAHPHCDTQENHHHH